MTSAYFPIPHRHSLTSPSDDLRRALQLCRSVPPLSLLSLLLTLHQPTPSSRLSLSSVSLSPTCIPPLPHSLHRPPWAPSPSSSAPSSPTSSSRRNSPSSVGSAVVSASSVPVPLPSLLRSHRMPITQIGSVVIALNGTSSSSFTPPPNPRSLASLCVCIHPPSPINPGDNPHHMPSYHFLLRMPPQRGTSFPRILLHTLSRFSTLSSPLLPCPTSRASFRLPRLVSLIVPSGTTRRAVCARVSLQIRLCTAKPLVIRLSAGNLCPGGTPEHEGCMHRAHRSWAEQSSSSRLDGPWLSAMTAAFIVASRNPYMSE